MSEQPQVTRYPSTDAIFAATVDASLASIGGRPTADTEILAAVEALLRDSYPLATLTNQVPGADQTLVWDAFRDDAVRDAEMLVRAGAGDAAAFEELYDRHSGHAFGLALRITNDRPLAEEVTQEAFLSLWRNASAFDPARASVRTWLMSITHNRAVDAIRRRRAPTTDLETAIDARVVDAHMSAPDVWPEVSARLDQSVVQRALASLPAPQRVAVELAYFSGLTQPEIAAHMSIPLGTVKSRVRLGLSCLRAQLAMRDSDAERCGGVRTG